MGKNAKPMSEDGVVSFESTLLLMDSPLWGAFIPVTYEIASFYKERGIQRLVCEINYTLHLHCALMPGGNHSFFILMNKNNVKKLKIKPGDSVHVMLAPDHSQYGMPLGEELEALLEEDFNFAHHFEKLTPGKQRNLIYLINKAKSSEIRLRTAVAVAGHLDANNGKLDFKMLNEALKNK